MIEEDTNQHRPDPKEQRNDEVPFEFVDIPTLTAIFSARTHDSEGVLRFGIQKKQLLSVIGITDYQLVSLLEKYSELIAPLGLEIIEFKDGSSVWLALRHARIAPMQLSHYSQSLLGILISKLYKQKNPVNAEDLRQDLVTRGFVTNAEFTNGLQELVTNRFISRKRGKLRLDVRCFLEFTENDLQEIQKEVNEIIGGTE